MMMSRLALVGCVACATFAGVASETFAPEEGETMELVPDAYRAYLAKPRAERIALFSNETARAQLAKSARNLPLGVTFRWPGSRGGELIVEKLPGRETFFKGTIPSNAYALVNFEIARDYAWRVTTPEGLTTGAMFKTSAMAPRMINWPKIPNVRDLGGRPGLGGKRVKQGLIYRSAGLNDNAVWGFLKEADMKAAYEAGNLEETLAKTIDGNGNPSNVKHYAPKIAALLKAGKPLPKHYCDRKFLLPGDSKPGKERLTDETRAWGVNWLGIKTDLDLRTYREVWGMKGSPLGPQVKWLQYASANYDGMASESGRAAFTKCFKVFLDKANYPIVFHCIAGADRTGSLACILNALLGVEEDELYRDWEVTGLSFGGKGTYFAHGTRFDKLITVFDKYPGATLHERIEAYVLSCGFTKDDIAHFRDLMLE